MPLPDVPNKFIYHCAVRIPAGPAFIAIDGCGFSALPLKLNTMIVFSTMHSTSSNLLSLLQTAPWHQCPTLASVIGLSRLPTI